MPGQAHPALHLSPHVAAQARIARDWIAPHVTDYLHFVRDPQTTLE